MIPFGELLECPAAAGFYFGLCAAARDCLGLSRPAGRGIDWFRLLAALLILVFLI